MDVRTEKTGRFQSARLWMWTPARGNSGTALKVNLLCYCRSLPAAKRCLDPRIFSLSSEIHDCVAVAG